MTSFRLTVYEILGYIEPGIVGLAALSIVFWSAFLPHYALRLAHYALTKEELALFLFAAYAIGHLLQGLCNYHPSPERLLEKCDKHATLIANARDGLTRRCSMNLDKYDLGEIVALAQTYLLSSGKTDDHDVFLYREGFYRASSAGYLLLAAALIFRTLCAGTNLVVNGTVTTVSSYAIFFFALISFLTSFVFYQRYRRFSTYRLLNLLNFACMPKADSAEITDATKSKEENGD